MSASLRTVFCKVSVLLIDGSAAYNATGPEQPSHLRMAVAMVSLDAMVNDYHITLAGLNTDPI